MRLKFTKVVCLLLAQMTIPTSGYNVLHFPIPARSHAYSQFYMGRELIRRGHEVHLLLHWSFPIPDEWLETAKSGKMFFHAYGNNSKTKVNADDEVHSLTMEMLTRKLGPEYSLLKAKEYNTALENDLVHESDPIMDHLESLNFDAVVLDYAYFMKHQVYVAHRLKLPVITFWDMVEPWLIRTPWMPSNYEPLEGIVKKSSTFYSRTINFLKQLLFELRPPFEIGEEKTLTKFRRYGEFDCPEKIISNSILFLVPQDPVIDYVRPVTANVIFVGGLTTVELQTSESMLEKEYLDFMEINNESRMDGTIVVSFGTMVKKYPEHIAKIFLEAFQKLPQYKFIWRFENHLNLSIPENAKITKWLPQKELLGHSSVKLFITHSGNNGQFEALYHGVPMLAVYLLGDQPRNALRITERGYGLMLDFRTLDVDQLVTSIQTIVTDPSYKERIMKASMIFKSKPDTPAERAAFWIEHVLQYGGDHLKPIGNDLTIWQYLCIDVLLFIEFVLFVLLVLIVAVVWKIIKNLFYGTPLPRKRSSNVSRGFKRKKQN